MSDRAVSERRKKAQKAQERRGRTTSNIFSAFTQQEIQEFKEAFNMIDQNHDGFIDHDDLMDMMTSLGAPTVSDDEVAKMLNDAPGPVNFTMFLTMFSERLQSTDPGKVLFNAFRMFDEQQTGFVSEDRLRHLLTSFCNRWTQEMVEELYSSPQLVDNRGFNYVEFVRRIKGYVAMDDEEELQKKLFEQKELDGESFLPRKASFKYLNNNPPPVQDFKRSYSSVVQQQDVSTNNNLVQTATSRSDAFSVPISRILEESPGHTPPTQRSSNANSALSRPPPAAGPREIPITHASNKPSQSSRPPPVTGPREIPITQASNTPSQSSTNEPINVPVSVQVPVEVRKQSVAPEALAPTEVRKQSVTSAKETVATVFDDRKALVVSPSLAESSTLSPVEVRVLKGSNSSSQQQSPVAKKLSTAALRQDFFSQSLTSDDKTKSNQQDLQMPNLFSKSVSPREVENTQEGSSKQQIQETKRISMSGATVVPIVSTGEPSTSSKTYIPVPVVVNKAKRSSQDLSDASKSSFGQDEAPSPSIRIEANFRSYNSSENSSASNPTVLPSSSANTESFNSKATPWRHQQQQSKPGQSINIPIAQMPVENRQTTEPPSIPPKRPGSSDRLQNKTPVTSSLMTASATNLGSSPAPSSVQVMLMQENPLNRQTPAFGYRAIPTTFISGTDGKTETLKSLETAPAEPPDPSDMSFGERKLSFAKIVLSGGNNNLMTASSLGSLPRASITNRMPPLSRIKSIESNGNNAANRIMSTSMVSFSNRPSGASNLSPIIDGPGNRKQIADGKPNY